MRDSSRLRKPRIHLWAPGLLPGTGGIQYFCRTITEAIQQLHPDASLRVVSKNDLLPPGDPLLTPGLSQTSAAWAPGRIRTAVMAALGTSAALMERPDLILCLHVNFTPAVAPLRKFLGIPYATFLYGIDAWSAMPASRLQGLLSADWVYAISNFTLQSAHTRHGINLAKTSLLPCTFDEGAFKTGPKPSQLLAQYGLKPDQPVFLTVGRLDKAEQYKGHRTMLAALPQILSSHPGARYIIAGSGNDLDALKQTARNYGVADAVTFAGFVPESLLPDYYRLCDVFVMPSKFEGFGIVFLEAMASGKPVIAGNQDGSVDALDQGRLGALVSPEDPADLALTAIALLNRSHPNSLLFDPGRLRQEVCAQFGFESFKNRFAGPLNGLLASART